MNFPTSCELRTASSGLRRAVLPSGFRLLASGFLLLAAWLLVSFACAPANNTTNIYEEQASDDDDDTTPTIAASRPALVVCPTAVAPT